MMKKSTVGLLLAFLFIGLACEKEGSLAKTSKSPSSIEVHDGRLVFSSNEDLHQWIKTFAMDKKAALESINFEGFKSIRKSFESIDLDAYTSQTDLNALLEKYDGIITMWREGKETYLDINSHGVFYPYLCNNQGIFQIGDSVYKVTREKFFSFHKRYVNMVDQAQNIPSINIREFIDLENYDIGYPELRNNVEDCESYYNSNQRKLKGRNGIEYGPGNFFVFSASSTHYKRGFLGIWFQENVATIAVSCGGWTDDCPPTSGSNTANNASQTGVILCSGTASSGNVSFEMSSYHECTRVGTSGVASCSILNGD